MLERYIKRINDIGINIVKIGGEVGATGWLVQLKEHNACVIAKDLSHNAIVKILDSIASHHKQAYEETMALRKEIEKEYYQRALHNANNQVHNQQKKESSIG